MTVLTNMKKILQSGNCQLFGLFDKYLWRNEMTGASLFQIKTRHTMLFEQQYCQKENRLNPSTGAAETWYTVCCDGGHMLIPEFYHNAPLFVTGYFRNQQDNGYGWDFMVVDIREASDMESATIEYLISGVFDGITYADAVKIVQTTGADIYSYVQEEKGALIKIIEATGLDIGVVKSLIKGVMRTALEKQVFDFLNKMAIPYPNCVKAVKKYGTSALDQIRMHPYTVGRDVGLSFRQSDQIAKEEGWDAFHPERLAAINELAINLLAEEGHVWNTRAQFEDAAIKVAKRGCFPAEGITLGLLFAYAPDSIATESGTSFNVDGFVLTHRYLAHAEERIAKNIRRLCTGQDEPFHHSYVWQAEKACGMTYGRQQKLAFRALLSKRGINILVGGPGTGKTSTLKGILTCYEVMHPDHTIRLCAPTGRAAQRMAESTGREATTIHRLLEYHLFGEEGTYKNEADPIEADLVVVDESSMISIKLMDMLLAALKTDTTLILVGDTNQLESVGAGAILRDLLNEPEDKIPRAVLTEVFRQARGSLIIDNAYAINSGIETLASGSDFEITRVANPQQMLDRIVDLATLLYDPNDPFATQVLCPAKAGVSGITAINEKLQAVLNPNKKGLKYGRTTYRINDKIIMLNNNYQVEQWYYNGDIGIVRDIGVSSLEVVMRGETFHMSKTELQDMQLAYGMTIHKSQGSEFQNVITALPMQPSIMLTRNLLYTAVTRAKKAVHLLSEGDAYIKAIKTNKSANRRTTLQYADLSQSNNEKGTI